MINLHFSKRNNPDIMKSYNEWIITGNTTYKKVSKNGLWLTVSGEAKRSDVFTSDKMTFNCFIPFRLTNNKEFESLHARGTLEFVKNKTIFIVKEVL